MLSNFLCWVSTSISAIWWLWWPDQTKFVSFRPALIRSKLSKHQAATTLSALVLRLLLLVNLVILWMQKVVCRPTYYIAIFVDRVEEQTINDLTTWLAFLSLCHRVAYFALWQVFCLHSPFHQVSKDHNLEPLESGRQGSSLTKNIRLHWRATCSW